MRRDRDRNLVHVRIDFSERVVPHALHEVKKQNLIKKDILLIYFCVSLAKSITQFVIMTSFRASTTRTSYRSTPMKKASGDTIENRDNNTTQESNGDKDGSIRTAESSIRLPYRTAVNGYVTPTKCINLFGSSNDSIMNHALERIKRRFDFIPINSCRRLDFSDELQI